MTFYQRIDIQKRIELFIFRYFVARNFSCNDFTKALELNFDIESQTEYQIPKIGAKIMNLQDPTIKMSKSAPKDDKGTIFMLDDIEITRKKIMSAVTDNDNKIKFDEESNLKYENGMILTKDNKELISENKPINELFRDLVTS